MGAQPRPMAIIKTCLHRSNSNALHLLHSLYQRLHQACLPGRHLLRLGMADLKAFCLQVSIRLSNKAFPHRVLRHLQVSVLPLDLDHLLAKVLHPGCLLDFNSQVLEGQGSREGSEAHGSSDTARKGQSREKGMCCPHKIQDYQKSVFLTNEVSGCADQSAHSVTGHLAMTIRSIPKLFARRRTLSQQPRTRYGLRR